MKKGLLVRTAALTAAAAITLCSVEWTSFAESEKASQSVRVIVKNETFTEEVNGKAPAFTGVLLDEWTELNDSSTALSSVLQALSENGISQTGGESGYFTEIGGLSAYDGGEQSGWMGTLNDWFTDEGFSAYTVANGKLSDGDEICMMYSMDWGADLGSDWSGTDTSLKSISSDKGTLSPAFAPNTKEYTLTVPFGTKEISFRPTALNKNFKVSTLLDGKEVKLSRPLPIAEGSVFTVTCGGKSEYKVTVKIGERPAPKIDSLDIMTTSLSDGSWVKGESFSPEKYEYQLELKRYSVSSIMLSSSTAFDDTLLTVTASYIDANGEQRNMAVNSKKATTLSDLPFGQSKLTLTAAYIDVPEIKTDYVFTIFRPFDTTAAIASTSGIAVIPEERPLMPTLYKGKAEGTVFRLDDEGNVTDKTGTSADVKGYAAYLLEDVSSFSLSLKGKTDYVHFRTSTDGKDWAETVNGLTPLYSFNDGKSINIKIQAISDESYRESGFSNTDGIAEYEITVINTGLSHTLAQITDAEQSDGDIYPAFSPEFYDYSVIIANDAEYPTLNFNVSEGCTVSVGNDEIAPSESGKYTIELTSIAKKISVSSADITNTYSFIARKRSKYDVPDKVTDYLCINSQYTNKAPYGTQGEATLAQVMKSLGGYGGYITYYYEDPITDDARNPYGADFYIYGNSFTAGGSAAESGQVYVSEDGEKWYALAGSEHFDDNAVTDYSITYTKAENGKTAWSDSLGNRNDGSKGSGVWVDPACYPLNSLAKGESITLSGVLLKCADGTVTGDGTTAAYVSPASFGYADYFPSSSMGKSVPMYTEDARSNGFDLAWAVDENGEPVTFANGIHYIKVATVSNIWAGSFGEKSTEISTLIRTEAAEEPTGVTALPEKITVTAGEKILSEIIPENGKVYEVKVGLDKTALITVLGTEENANIYINNKRADSSEVTIDPLKGRTVRVIVQTDEKQPVIFYIKLISDDMTAAREVDELIDAIGTVTLDSIDAINEARKAYDSLSESAASLVENIDLLIAAENEYQRLLEEKITADKAAAAYVDELISAIGSVSADSLDAITKARGAYNALSDDAKAYVEYLDILAAAEQRYNKIKAYKDCGAEYEEIFKATAEELCKADIFPLSDIGGEWTVIGLKRADMLSDTAKEKYISALTDVVKAIGSDTLSRKATDNARTAIALAALGIDPSDFAGYDLLRPLTDTDFVTRQGINGAIFALIALNCTDYKTDVREKLIDIILNAEVNGGWTLYGDTPDVDVTAMALEALAPYYGKNNKVTKAVDEAADLLISLLDENCEYKTTESIAQVIIAFCALGIDPTEVSVSSINLIDALCAAYQDGGFVHVKGGEFNRMATEQAFMALTAYRLFTNGKGGLYDFNIKTAQKPDNTDTDETTAATDSTAPEQGGKPAGTTSPEQSGTPADTTMPEQSGKPSDTTTPEDSGSVDSENQNNPNTGAAVSLLPMLIGAAVCCIAMLGKKK